MNITCTTRASLASEVARQPAGRVLSVMKVLLKVVKPEENYDLIGNKKCYVMNKKFTMVFLYRYTTDEDMVRIIDNIPNSDQMRFLITEP